jgi:hypothetical protein
MATGPWPLATADAQSNGVVAPDVYLHPQQFVAIDGTGEPTVLFDAGAGESMMVWRHVQGQIAATTRACAYDRAGYGFSDSATRASDARNTVDDLHRLLRAARIATPIVYDPAFAHPEDRMTAAFQPADRATLTKAYAAVLDFIRGCVALARSGALAHPSTTAASACVDTRLSDDIGDTLRHELARQYAQPSLQKCRALRVQQHLAGSRHDECGQSPARRRPSGLRRPATHCPDTRRGQRPTAAGTYARAAIEHGGGSKVGADGLGHLACQRSTRWRSLHVQAVAQHTVS